MDIDFEFIDSAKGTVELQCGDQQLALNQLSGEAHFDLLRRLAKYHIGGSDYQLCACSAITIDEWYTYWYSELIDEGISVGNPTPRFVDDWLCRLKLSKNQTISVMCRALALIA
jgi:hypothetical protein